MYDQTASIDVDVVITDPSTPAYIECCWHEARLHRLRASGLWCASRSCAALQAQEVCIFFHFQYCSEAGGVGVSVSNVKTCICVPVGQCTWRYACVLFCTLCLVAVRYCCWCLLCVL